MNPSDRVAATTMSDLIDSRLNGILNKLEIVATSDEDKQLQKALQSVATHQKQVSNQLSLGSERHESK